MKNLQLAQTELDSRIADYYSRNEDGGNYEERYVIAQRVANRFGLDPIEAKKLDF